MYATRFRSYLGRHVPFLSEVRVRTADAYFGLIWPYRFTTLYVRRCPSDCVNSPHRKLLHQTWWYYRIHSKHIIYLTLRDTRIQYSSPLYWEKYVRFKMNKLNHYYNVHLIVPITHYTFFLFSVLLLLYSILWLKNHKNCKNNIKLSIIYNWFSKHYILYYMFPRLKFDVLLPTLIHISKNV